MLIVLVIIAIGLTPALISMLLSIYSRRQVQQSLYLAADYAANERFRQRPERASVRVSTRSHHPDERYVEGMGFVIGDITCQLNARSPFIRCAPNPVGPCEGCREYEGREYEDLACERKEHEIREYL